VLHKIGLKTIPMSYHELNLDDRKASKHVLKVVLCVGPVVLHVEQILLRMPILPIFDYLHDFSLMMDDLLM